MGGSGGGASGAVSYPTYMVTFHNDILNNSGNDLADNSFIDAFNIAYGNSPFAGAVAFDPTAALNAAQVVVEGLFTTIGTLNHLSDFTTAAATARTSFLLGTTTLDTTTQDVSPLDSVTLSDEDIAQDVAAMDSILTEQLEQNELPRFRAGMLNINAVHSSAYIIGEALLRSSKDKALTKYGTDLRLKLNDQIREINARLMISHREINARHALSYREITSRLQTSKKDIDAKFYIHREELVRLSTTAMLADLMKKMDLSYQHAHLNTEFRRIGIVTEKERQDEQLSIDESDAKWDIELFRYAGNILAAPSGGVAQGNEKKSRAVSAIGGAISGAATGAMVGSMIGGVGAAPGAAIGAVAGVGLAMLQ